MSDVGRKPYIKNFSGIKGEQVENPTFETNLTPDINNYRDQNAEFESLSKELTEKELELSTLEKKLSLFERKYAKAVGIFIAELDEIEKEIAKELLRLNPKEEYRQGFQRAENKAKASRGAVDEKMAHGDKNPFEPSDEIRNLFRRVAKAIHPDFATDPEERAFRNMMMIRANEAYKKGDLEGLKMILDKWENRDKKSYPDQAALIHLDQLEQKIRQIKLRINNIDMRISELMNSELYQLMVKVEQSEFQGCDFLAEMGKRVQEQILEAKKLLESLQQKV
jgi:hypothetical protein